MNDRSGNSDSPQSSEVLELQTDVPVGLQPRLLICVTVYNEPSVALEATLCSLQEALAWAHERGHPGAGEACIAIIIDGCERADPALLNGLADRGLVRRPLQPPEGHTRFFFSPRPAVGTTAPGFVVSLKGRNRGKLHSHALFFDRLCTRLQPELCFQVDCGTTIGAAAIAAMLDRFAKEPRLAALASRITTPAEAPGPLGRWQFMDFATQAAVAWPAEQASGYLSVLPGQFCGLRWEAIAGGAAPDPASAALGEADPGPAVAAADRAAPLARYLRGLAPSTEFERVMFLAEDRVLGEELLLAGRTWKLGYCVEAEATTDACCGLRELLRQRRRWNNGSSASRLWFVWQAAVSVGTGHLRLVPALLWQLLTMAQQLARPAVLVCTGLLVARAVGNAVQHGPLALPLVAASALLVALGMALGDAAQARWRQALRDAAFACAAACLVLMLGLVLAPGALALVLMPQAGAVLLTALLFGTASRIVWRHAAEYHLIVNPLLQVVLWGYALARLGDTSWGTKGLTNGRAGSQARRSRGLAALGAWAIVNLALVAWASSTPPFFFAGLDPLLEVAGALCATTLVLAVRRPSTRWRAGSGALVRCRRKEQ